MSVQLGKIEEVRIGKGGYQNAMFGVTFVLSGDSWATIDFKGTWDVSIETPESGAWSDLDRLRILGEAMMFLSELMNKAKVAKMEDLKGVPISATFSDKLEGWRVLTEVR